MCSESHLCLIFLFLQAFQETIEIFQQKNESFKNALKDVEEVSVSVTPELYARSSSVDIFLQRHTEYMCFYLTIERRAGEACPSLDSRQWSDDVYEV